MKRITFRRKFGTRQFDAERRAVSRLLLTLLCGVSALTGAPSPGDASTLIVSPGQSRTGGATNGLCIYAGGTAVNIDVAGSGSAGSRPSPWAGGRMFLVISGVATGVSMHDSPFTPGMTPGISVGTGGITYGLKVYGDPAVYATDLHVDGGKLVKPRRAVPG